MCEDLVNDFLERVSTRLAWYTVGLIRVKKDPSADNLCGSGTLVSFGGVYAILTAQHVVAEFRRETEIGLCLTRSAHRHVLDNQYLHIIEIGCPVDVSSPNGPDLALVRIPDTHVGTLKSVKSFYELSCANDGTPKPSEYGLGLWHLSGYIGHWTKDGGQEGSFSHTRAFCLLNGASGTAEDYQVRDGFDYCSVIVKYEIGGDNPHSFEGLSGGGLWKVAKGRVEGDRITIKNMHLFGVAFHQSKIAAGTRRIVCHGCKSIYEKAVEALT